MPARIVIAHHHSMLREGLHRLLESQPDFTIVGQATNAPETIHLLHELQPDIMLLGMSMPRMMAINILRQVRTTRMPALRTLLLTTSLDKPRIAEALILGARGVVTEHSPSAELFRAIRGVVEGELWVSRNLVPRLVEILREGQPFGLTTREQQIVTAVVEGCANKDIALAFHVTEYTVKHHLTSIFQKLGVSNRVELAKFSIEHSLGNPYLRIASE